MRTALQLAWKMVKEKRQRAFLLVLSTAIAACLLFTSYYFIHSLNTSSEALAGRLGADLIIVPKGLGTYAAENAINGSVTSIYFNENEVVHLLRTIDEVTEVAPQLYLETISTSCCGTMGDFPIVAFDPTQDFTLHSWMPGAQDLGADEIVIGIRAGGERFLYHYNDKIIKEKVMLFLEPFFVRNALFPTGTGADETIFMRLDTARKLIKEVDSLNHIQKTDVSAIYVNTEPHTELYVKQLIESKIPFVDVALGSGLKEQMKKQIVPLKLLSYAMVIMALILTLLQVAMMFSAIIRERQKEIGVLFALGVTKFDVYKLLLSEAVIISIIGTSIGVLFSLSILFDRQTLLYMIFELPLMFPNLFTSLVIGFGTMVVITVCSIIAALFPIRTFIEREPYDVVREGEL